MRANQQTETLSYRQNTGGGGGLVTGTPKSLKVNQISNTTELYNQIKYDILLYLFLYNIILS